MMRTERRPRLSTSARRCRLRPCSPSRNTSLSLRYETKSPHPPSLLMNAVAAILAPAGLQRSHAVPAAARRSEPQLATGSHSHFLRSILFRAFCSKFRASAQFANGFVVSTVGQGERVLPESCEPVRCFICHRKRRVISQFSAKSAPPLTWLSSEQIAASLFARDSSV